MALALKRCCPLGRSRAGKTGCPRKGTTLSEKKNKQIETSLASRCAVWWPVWWDFLPGWGILIWNVNPLWRGCITRKKRHTSCAKTELLSCFFREYQKTPNSCHKCFEDNLEWTPTWQSQSWPRHQSIDMMFVWWLSFMNRAQIITLG